MAPGGWQVWHFYRWRTAWLVLDFTDAARTLSCSSLSFTLSLCLSVSLSLSFVRSWWRKPHQWESDGIIVLLELWFQQFWLSTVPRCFWAWSLPSCVTFIWVTLSPVDVLPEVPPPTPLNRAGHSHTRTDTHTRTKPRFILVGQGSFASEKCAQLFSLPAPKVYGAQERCCQLHWQNNETS